VKGSFPFRGAKGKVRRKSMKRFLLIITVVAGVVFLAPETLFAQADIEAATAEGKVFAPGELDKLRPLVGQMVTIEGMPVLVGENKTGTMRYVNFTNDYRQSVALVFGSKRPDTFLPKEKLEEYVGKKLRVKGILDEYRNRLQIEIIKLDQIEVLP
jgi:DNA/RNA endonuclease YhcR with UshA esterase domain